MGAPTRARWKRKKDLPGLIAFYVLFGLLLSAVVAFFIWGSFATGQTLEPSKVLQAAGAGQLTFSGQYFVVLGVVVGVLAAAVVLLSIWYRKTMIPASWVDVAAQHMASPKEAGSLSRKAVEKKARELGVKGVAK